MGQGAAEIFAEPGANGTGKGGRMLQTLSEVLGGHTPRSGTWPSLGWPFCTCLSAYRPKRQAPCPLYRSGLPLTRE